MTTATAAAKAEVLREEIGKMAVYHRGVSLGTVTVSMSVAISKVHGEHAEELMRAADRALYRAKAEGRNRVVMADIEKRGGA